MGIALFHGLYIVRFWTSLYGIDTGMNTGIFPARIATLIAYIALASSLACSTLTHSEEVSKQWRWSGVERVVAVGDIHGAFSEFIALLQATGLTGRELQWIGGDTHLVSLGDILDRGTESRKVMDLLIRLQQEAPTQGGRVHVLAGNHEIMNLMGDFRYISKGEYAAFSREEPADKREQAFAEFLTTHSEPIAQSFFRGGVLNAERDTGAKKLFDKLFPSGYFGHRRAFSSKGLYGNWLQSRPAIIVINQTAYTHGGLPEITATASLDQLNRQFQANIRRYLLLWNELIDANILPENSPETAYQLAAQALDAANARPCALDARRDCRKERLLKRNRARTFTPQLKATLEEFITLSEESSLGVNGPLWYRGSVRCKEILEMPILTAALENLHAKRVVVGHTPTTDRRVHSIRNGKLTMLDTGMLASHYKGRPAALISQAGKSEVQYLNPIQRAAPLTEGGNGYYRLNNAQLKEALKNGEITKVITRLKRKPHMVEVTFDDMSISAKFFPDDKRRSSHLELAAYEFDQLLGFNMVPITVPRTIDNISGALQLSYPNRVSELERLRKGIETANWCPLQSQRNLMYVFDLLLDNSARSKRDVLYETRRWDLYATGHRKAFSDRHKLFKSRSEFSTAMIVALRKPLASLDKSALSATLGQWLDQDQIDALLGRRDAFLAKYDSSR